MSAFSIITGFMLAFTGMISGPHILRSTIKNHMDARAEGFLSMLPSFFLFTLEFYLK